MKNTVAKIVRISNYHPEFKTSPLQYILCSHLYVNIHFIVCYTSKSYVSSYFQVDQLVKFNQSLIDHSSASAGTKSVIDGILLTKFDCIDDKVSVHLFLQSA